MEENAGGIHYENPFVTPIELRDPARRLRGRLASGVTLWTSGPPEEPTGLTMSSVMIAEGEPPVMFGLLNDTSSLFDALQATSCFVVHILEESDRVLSDRFAGLVPAPGGPFVGLEVEESPYGPVLPDRDRAYCRLTETEAAGYQNLIRANIEGIELTDLDRPLIHFRGRYRPLR